MPHAPPPTDGPVLAPYAVSVPEGARPLGVAPFLGVGDVVMWRYRDHGWRSGSPENTAPMRVVRDDERGLVAWLAPGTVQADGTINVKDADELEAAVEQGRVTAGQARAIRLNGEHGRASFARGDWPFDDEWTRWPPDPAWTTPALRDDERWTSTSSGTEHSSAPRRAYQWRGPGL